MIRKILTSIIIVAFITTGAVTPEATYGQDGTSVPQVGETETEESTAILSFKDLGLISNQTIYVGDVESSVLLPPTLTGYNQNGEEVFVEGVTWQIDRNFDSATVGTFLYTAVLPETYYSSCGLPTIKVNIQKRPTLVTGLQTTINRTAGSTLVDNINVTNPDGRKLYLQFYKATTKQWVTKWSITMPVGEIETIALRYPSTWYSNTKTQWRIYIPETSKLAKYISSTININVKRYYQNPTAYYQINKAVTLKSNAGYNLKYGTMGLKVAMVQRKLGMGMTWEIVGPATQTKIRQYQKKKSLPVTGVVNYTMWKKLGFSDYDWYYKAAYVSPMKINLASSKKECIEAFIANAYRYVGTEYIVGAAGAPKTGIDCSGLVMQSMYATGIDPYPISVIRHSQPGYEYESRNLWASTKLKTVKYDDRKRGDLIFYKNKSGTIIHVAIYLGNNKVIESTPPSVRVSKIINASYTRIKGVKRVFI